MIETISSITNLSSLSGPLTLEVAKQIIETQHNLAESGIAFNWIDSISSLLQAIAFIVVAFVAIFTYLKAKPTLLQPFRTEVFKEQVKKIIELSSYFIGITEVELRKDLGLGSLVSINFLKMRDDYGKLFFDEQFDYDNRPYGKNYCPECIVKREALILSNDYLKPKKPNSIEPSDSRTRAAIWLNYKCLDISLPKTYSETFRRLKILSQAPFLPKECVTLLREYLKTVQLNVDLLFDLFTEASREFPEKYPTIEALKNYDDSWIHNRYNDIFIPLEPFANRFETLLREHLGTDKLLSFK